MGNANNPGSVYKSIEEHVLRYYDHNTSVLNTGLNLHFTDYQSTARLGFQLEGSAARIIMYGTVDTGGTWTFDMVGTHIASGRFGEYAADSGLFGGVAKSAFDLGWVLGQALVKGQTVGATAATGGQDYKISYQTG